MQRLLGYSPSWVTVIAVTAGAALLIGYASIEGESDDCYVGDISGIPLLAGVVALPVLAYAMFVSVEFGSSRRWRYLVGVVVGVTAAWFILAMLILPHAFGVRLERGHSWRLWDSGPAV